MRTTTFRGRNDVPISEVANELGLSYQRVWQRCAVGRANGDDLERELSQDDYRARRSSSPLVTIGGVTKTRAEWQRELGIGETVVSSRVWLGWPIERALTEPVNRRQRPTSKPEKEAKS